MKKILLACESSCDETAFCLYDLTSKKIIDSVINSQLKIHKDNGGVIPELASKEHYKNIDILLSNLLISNNINLSEIDFFAATKNPGLPGALLIGYTFCKSIAWHFSKPYLSINHLEGHIFSSFLTNPNIPFPHLCLSISGGHTSLYLITNFLEYTKLGNTRDDSAGECFDKIAKLLKLPYPGGKYIEELAAKKKLNNIRNYPISKMSDNSISFSGLKTAVLYDVINNNWYNKVEKRVKPETPLEFIIEVANSTQYVINNMLGHWLEKNLITHNTAKAVTVVGGVACNNFINEHLKKIVEKKNITFFRLEKKFCGDNADMIAYVAAKKIELNTYENSYQEEIKI